MTNTQLDTTGFIYVSSERSIESITYRDYLDAYGKDETTTPHGIADRLHIREEVIDIDENGDEVKEWQMWSWGVGGNHPYYCGPTFDNEEGAILYSYERSEWYVREKNYDAPCFFDTEKEAIEDFANSVDKSFEVAERYIRLSRYTAKRKSDEKILFYENENRRKEALKLEIAKEVDEIVIDEQFKIDVKNASLLSGNEKSNACAAAMKGLLFRLNKEKINSDFWKVFRILKSKIDG